MPDDDVISLLARACERLVGSVFDALDEAGAPELGTTQALAIRMLDHGPLTARALGTALGITPQAAGRISADLEEQGLAERRRDPRDARARPLALTSAGEHIAAAMRSAEDRATEQWRAAAGAADSAATARALRAYLVATEPPRTPQPRRMRFS